MKTRAKVASTTLLFLLTTSVAYANDAPPQGAYDEQAAHVRGRRGDIRRPQVRGNLPRRGRQDMNVGKPVGRLRMVFERLDANHDGRLEFYEAAMALPRHAQRIRRLFRRLDQNRDGAIDRRELHAASLRLEQRRHQRMNRRRRASEIDPGATFGRRR